MLRPHPAPGPPAGPQRCSVATPCLQKPTPCPASPRRRWPTGSEGTDKRKSLSGYTQQQGRRGLPRKRRKGQGRDLEKSELTASPGAAWQANKASPAGLSARLTRGPGAQRDLWSPAWPGQPRAACGHTWAWTMELSPTSSFPKEQREAPKCVLRPGHSRHHLLPSSDPIGAEGADEKAQAALRGTQSSARRAPLGEGLPLTQPQLVSLPVKRPSPSLLPGG